MRTTISVLLLILFLLLIGWVGTQPEPDYCKGSLHWTKACSLWWFK
jgi:hypothetical protein